MKRAIIKALNEIESQLSGQSAVATYSYMMLCVKAEEMALLPVSINIEGEEKYIEEVASVVKPDDYTFIVIPHFDEDLVAVKSGIHAQYPAFQLEVESKTVDVYDKKEENKPIPVAVKYLKVTIPSVNDDRKEELTQDVGWPTLCQGSDRAAGAGRPRFRGRYRAERRPHDACREVLRQGMTQGADKK